MFYRYIRRTEIEQGLGDQGALRKNILKLIFLGNYQMSHFLFENLVFYKGFFAIRLPPIIAFIL